MNSKKTVIKNSFLYTFSSLLVKAFNFLLIPLYTYHLTTEQYGIVNLINSFMNVSIFIVGFSLYTAIIRFYVEYKDDNDKLKDYISAIVMFISLSSLIFITLGV